MRTEIRLNKILGHLNEQQATNNEHMYIKLQSKSNRETEHTYTHKTK